MATHAPVYRSAPASETAAAAPALTPAAEAPLRTVVLTLGAVALWMGAVLGLQQLSAHAFGYAALDAWALALGVVTYVAAFIGVMVGLVAFVLHADRLQLERER